ncbi:MAG: translation initiation factor IF-2 associated domain-containing protein, partial [Sinobacterium sp.]|nr:translation initiation factor IF-2 associated domain-containing protein [Sinobacterium sp.]
MAEVTVKQLSETVGTPIDKLLTQMKDAGLSHSAADEVVSDDDKQTLLTFLKGVHGSDDGEPQKITLKRKKVTTLKSSSQGKKAVHVEVRKKRTYVKRDEEAAEQEAEKVAEEAAAVKKAAVEDAAEKAAVEKRAHEEVEAARKATEEAEKKVVEAEKRAEEEAKAKAKAEAEIKANPELAAKEEVKKAAPKKPAPLTRKI